MKKNNYRSPSAEPFKCSLRDIISASFEYVDEGPGEEVDWNEIG
ncbi:MAG: hypothetical protein ACI3XQ_05255 [Eubacteriales bacterium]